MLSTQVGYEGHLPFLGAQESPDSIIVKQSLVFLWPQRSGIGRQCKAGQVDLVRFLELLENERLVSVEIDKRWNECSELPGEEAGSKQVRKGRVIDEHPASTWRQRMEGILNKRDPRCKPLESALPGLFCHFSQDISFVVAVATVKLEIRVPSLAIDEYLKEHHLITW